MFKVMKTYINSLHCLFPVNRIESDLHFYKTWYSAFKRNKIYSLKKVLVHYFHKLPVEKIYSL